MNSRLALLETLSRELSALVSLLLLSSYYLDNGAILLLLRMVVQLTFVTQRPPAPSNPQILPTVFASLFGILYHTFILPAISDSASPYEYSHGSVLVDFVGEKGPVSRWRLVFLDCQILLIQLAALAITFEHGKLQNGTDTSGQDVEAEEQGTRRSQDGQDIELQEMAQGIDGESALGAHPTDRFYTDYTVIELEIIKSLRELAKIKVTSTGVYPENGPVGSALSSVMARMAHQT